MKSKTVFILLIILVSVLQIPIPSVKADGSTDSMPVWVEYSKTNLEPWNSTGTYNDGSSEIDDNIRLSYVVFPSDIGNDEVNITRFGFKYYKQYNYGQEHKFLVYEADGAADAGNLLHEETFSLSAVINDWYYRTPSSEVELSGDFTVYIGAWSELKSGSNTISYESVSQSYGSIDKAETYGSAPDPLTGESQNSAIVYAVRVNYDHKGDTLTSHNQYYGSATYYTARRDYTYTFPSASSNREIRTLYPRDEYLVNISYYSGGNYNQELASNQYTDENYNGTHNLITIPEDTISSIGSNFRFYTSSHIYLYNLFGPYYENGTKAPVQNVTLHHPENTETLELNGTLTFGYTENPIEISWALSGGETRHLYLREENENFTVFLAEDTYDMYDFSIIDYTTKLGEGTAYLEAYRSVNGSEYLIERMKIYDVYNTVPLLLMYGQVYRLQILWSDDTTYDWGYWPAGTDTTPTLVIQILTFSQKAQLTYKYLSVEATRPNATRIRVNYEDESPSPYETNWCNITILYRNQTVVTSYNSTAESISWNWYSADNETDYWVFVDIDHSFFEDVEYKKLLDATGSYNTFPSLNVLGTFGGIDPANLFSLILVLGVFGAFSRKSADAALISAFSLAGLLRIIGANTWSYDLLAFGFALSVGYAIYRGRVNV